MVDVVNVEVLVFIYGACGEWTTSRYGWCLSSQMVWLIEYSLSMGVIVFLNECACWVCIDGVFRVLRC